MNWTTVFNSHSTGMDNVRELGGYNTIDGMKRKKNNYMNMSKNVLIIFALIMLSACSGRQTQSESADTSVADSTEVMAPKEMGSMASPQQSYSLTGTIGEDKASMVFDRNGNDVTGVVTRCDYCVPIQVKGTWQEDNITVAGASQAGSHIEYELTVTGKAVQGVETLSAEGEVEKQNVTMTIENS